jgi:hypothetical protein
VALTGIKTKMFIVIVVTLFAMAWYSVYRDLTAEPTPGVFIYPPELVGDAASNATVETLAYSGDGADDAWSACGTEAGEE